MPHTKQTETATVRKMHWVQVATADSTPAAFAAAAPIVEPPPPRGVSETSTVIAIYHAALSHADAARLADLLKREGFPGRVVLTLVDAP